ncbi:MAG: molybdate ABC transporter substrate-binding protein [Gammaproteobacteria bacterium]
MRAHRSFLGHLLNLVVIGTCAAGARADEVRVAVAANFTEAANAIAAKFEQASGHKVLYSFGSTGQLYAQITQGAPFQVFLSADRQRPADAVAAGLAVKDTLFTYATGRLVLYSADSGRVKGDTTLREAAFTRLAIASPTAAPYGAAAVETMKALGVHAAIEPKLVQGQNIAQTFQFIETGNAELGFVALSQVAGHARGSRWVVPETLHAPIAQDAVLLAAGDTAAARAFLAFLRGDAARAVKVQYGYGPGD